MVLHDRFALTLMAIGSLRANFAGEIELILVDSGSTDETRHIARYVRGARCLRFDTNIGFLHGCNAALNWVTADTVLYLNNDIELAPGALAAALRRLASDSGIGAVGGKIVRAHGLLQEAGNIIWRDGTTQGYLRDQSPLVPEANFVRDTWFCSGVFLLARTELLRQLEGFDVAYAPAYYEDADLCVRIGAGGVARGVRSRRGRASPGIRQRVIQSRVRSGDRACAPGVSWKSTANGCGSVQEEDQDHPGVRPLAGHRSAPRVVHRGHGAAAHDRLGLRAFERSGAGHGVDGLRRHGLSGAGRAASMSPRSMPTCRIASR